MILELDEPEIKNILTLLEISGKQMGFAQVEEFGELYKIAKKLKDQLEANTAKEG